MSEPLFLRALIGPDPPRESTSILDRSLKLTSIGPFWPRLSTPMFDWRLPLMLMAAPLPSRGAAAPLPKPLQPGWLLTLILEPEFLLTLMSFEPKAWGRKLGFQPVEC